MVHLQLLSMPKRRLLHQLYPSFLIVTLASIVGVGWLAIHLAEEFLLSRVTTDLNARAETVREMLGVTWTADDAAKASDAVEAIAKASGVRLSLVLPDGSVLASSSKRPIEAENQSDRPEFVSALANRADSSIRFVPDLDQRVSFFSLPVAREGKVIGVVHASEPIGYIDQAIAGITLRVVLVGLATRESR